MLTETYAELNHGRWIAECPLCHSAERVVQGEPMTCRAEFGGCGARYVVLFPENASEIEAAVASRPLQNRNWQRGETVEQLRAENQEHGL